MKKKTEFNVNSQMLLWRNLDRVDDRNYLIYLIMAADSPYVKVEQSSKLSKHVSRKLSLSKVISYWCKAQRRMSEHALGIYG
jgi:hypothetical protein